MSEEVPVILSNRLPEPAISGAGLGESLRMAREHLGLNVEEAARQLRLSMRQLMALEADDIGALPSPTFTRGFIRNYARLLQLDPEPLLAAYRAMLPESTEGASISLHSEGIPIQNGNRNSWLPYLVASVLLGIAGGGWWAYMDWRENLPVQPATVVKAAKPFAPVVSPPVVAQSQTEPASAAAAPPSVEPLQPSVSEALPAEPAPATTPTPTPTQASPSGAHILLKFTQPSWVRVSDRDDKEIFNQNKPSGTESVIEGNPPFKVEVGNAAGVQLSYNGQTVDLAPHTKANVARLTLE